MFNDTSMQMNTYSYTYPKENNGLDLVNYTVSCRRIVMHFSEMYNLYMS